MRCCQQSTTLLPECPAEQAYQDVLHEGRKKQSSQTQTPPKCAQASAQDQPRLSSDCPASRPYDPEADLIAKEIFAQLGHKETLPPPGFALNMRSKPIDRGNGLGVSATRPTSLRPASSRNSIVTGSDELQGCVMPSTQKQDDIRLEQAKQRINELEAENELFEQQLAQRQVDEQRQSKAMHIFEAIQSYLREFGPKIVRFEADATDRCLHIAEKLDVLAALTQAKEEAVKDLSLASQELEKVYHENSRLRAQICEISGEEASENSFQEDYQLSLNRQKTAHALTVQAFQNRQRRLETQLDVLKGRIMEITADGAFPGPLALENASLRRELSAIRDEEYELIRQTENLNSSAETCHVDHNMWQRAGQLISAFRTANFELSEQNLALREQVEILCGISASDLLIR